MTRRQRLGLALCHVLDALRAWLYARAVKEPVWRTFDGRVMLVREMSDGHLRNAIRMLSRPGDSPVMLAALQSEHWRRFSVPKESSR